MPCKEQPPAMTGFGVEPAWRILATDRRIGARCRMQGWPRNTCRKSVKQRWVCSAWLADTAHSIRRSKQRARDTGADGGGAWLSADPAAGAIGGAASSCLADVRRCRRLAGAQPAWVVRAFSLWSAVAGGPQWAFPADVRAWGAYCRFCSNASRPQVLAKARPAARFRFAGRPIAAITFRRCCDVPP